MTRPLFLALSLFALPSSLVAAQPAGAAPPAPSALREASSAATPAVPDLPESQMPHQPPAAPAAPKATTPAAPVAPPAPPAPPRPRGQMINVRIDVTLSDSQGVPKTLTMTIADGENGRNRTAAITGGSGRMDFYFNADAEPTVTGSKVFLRLSAEARVAAGDKAPAGQTPGTIDLRQTQALVIEDGKSVEIARAADPTTDRVFALSVKATIVR